MITLDKLIDQSGKLGSLPAIVYRIFEVMDDPNSTAIKIGRIINEDPALTARLLKLVNSPFYGFVSKVDTVYRAIALIGHRELRSVVLATSAIKAFDGIPEDLVDMEAFWKRSLNTAVVARVLAAFRREKEIERYFIVGLLHDIGSLLLYLQQPEQQTQAIVNHHAEKIPLWQAEKKVFGFDHAEVGGALLKKWNLPEKYCEITQRHHSEVLDKDDLFLMAVQLGNKACNNLDIGLRGKPLISPAWLMRRTSGKATPAMPVGAFSSVSRTGPRSRPVPCLAGAPGLANCAAPYRQGPAAGRRRANRRQYLGSQWHRS